MKKFFTGLKKTLSHPDFLVYFLILVILAVSGMPLPAAATLLSLLAVLSVRAAVGLRAASAFDEQKKLLPVPHAGEGEVFARTAFAGRFSTIFSRISVFFIPAAVPVILLGLVFPGNTLAQVCASVAAVMTPAFAAFSRTHAVYLDLIASDGAVSLCEKDGGEGAVLSDSSAIENFAAADTVMILDPFAVYDRTPEVREVWFGKSVYRGYSLDESGMRIPAERSAVLANVAAAFSDRLRQSRPGHDDAMIRFAEKQLGDLSEVMSSASGCVPLPDTPYDGDVSIRFIFDGAGIKSETLTRSASFAAARSADLYRTPNGRWELFDDAARKSALDAWKSAEASGLFPYCIISSAVPSDIAEEGEFPEGRVLECILAIGGVFPENNRQILPVFEDYGITPLLLMPRDSLQSRRFALDSGLCGDGSGEDDLCFAGKTGDGDFPEDDSVLRKKAFIGFSREEGQKLLRRFKKSGRNVSLVVRRASDLALLSESGSAAGVAGSAEPDAAAVLPAFVSSASGERPEGGLAAVFSLLSESAVIMSKMRSFALFAFCFGLFVTVCTATSVCGFEGAAPFPAMTLLVCEAVLAVCALTFSSDRMILRTKSASEMPRAEFLSRIVYRAGLALLTAVAVEVCGFTFFRADPGSRLSFVTPAVLFAGLSMIASERLEGRRRYGISGFNLRFVVGTLLSAAVFAGLVFLPVPAVAEPFLGNTSRPLIVLAVSLIPSAVPFIYSGVAALIRRFSGGKPDKRDV